MNEKLLHTPEGVRDIYNGECEKKLILENRMHEILKLYGFKDIQTPTFEFFDIFNKERGTIASKEMYKFFDREGNTLALRPDMTPAIARCVAKYFREEELPIRLCYVGNTFINNSRYQGKLKEITQIGAELINDSTVDADAQMIALSIECLQKAGLKDFQLEIGHVDFFNGIIEEAGFEEDEIEQLRTAIEEKNNFGVEELVSGKHIDDKLKEVLCKLPELFGNEDILEYAKSMTTNAKAISAVTRLKEVYDIISVYGLERYVTFDLGMLSKYNYYTGIILSGFTYGTGEAIITGGRYDKLVCQFGKDSAAIGVAIAIDQLMNALSRQKIEVELIENNTLILYSEQYRKVALTLANNFRSRGFNIEMLVTDKEHTIEEYKEYAKRIGSGKIIILIDQDTVNEISLQDDKTIEQNVADIIQ